MLGLFVEMKEKEDCFHFIACLCSVLLIGCFTEITRGPDSISSDKTIEQTENTGPDSRLYTSAVAALLLVKSMTYIAHCPAMTRCSVKDTLTEHGSKEKLSFTICLCPHWDRHMRCKRRNRGRGCLLDERIHCSVYWAQASVHNTFPSLVYSRELRIGCRQTPPNIIRE